MKIAVDAMGGDNAPAAIVEGVVDAVREFDVHVGLFGLEDRISGELKKHKYPEDKISVIHSPEVVGMHEPATVTIRKKRQSSITQGIQSVKEKKHDAFVSSGNTGAVVAAATIYLGMLEGVDRPAIGTVLPTLKDFCFMLDVGANTETKPHHLLHSAHMAAVYARQVLGVEDPTIGLLNIGAEETKGSGIQKEAHKLLTEEIPNFQGNIEANEVYAGKVDCIVCDGFVGNIVLKVSEGLMENTGKLIKQNVKRNPVALMGAFLMKISLKEIRKLADYSEYGGAPLLGVNGLVMIGHGRSNAKAVKNAIRATMREVEHNILTRMVKRITGE